MKARDLDPELLDALARVYAEAVLERLIAEAQKQDEQPTKEMRIGQENESIPQS